MSPRTGRPKSENAKNHDIKVRVDDITMKKLEEYCKRNNISIAQALRNGIDNLLTKEK